MAVPGRDPVEFPTTSRRALSDAGFEIVEARQPTQWFFRTTDYADRLLDHLDTIDWPQHVKTWHRQWIGRANRAHATFRREELQTACTDATPPPDPHRPSPSVRPLTLSVLCHPRHICITLK